MRAGYRYGFILLTILGNLAASFSQCKPAINLIQTGELFTNPAFGIGVSIKKDRLDRPYVYLSNKSAGLKIYNVSNESNPLLVATVLPSEYGNLDAIQVIQEGPYLYLTLGDIWNTNQQAGLAILDVANPLQVKVLDYYIHPGSSGGAGSVYIKDGIAYLAAMRNGLIVLDVHDKSNILFKSQVKFSNTFPHEDSSNVAAFNARGIWVKDSIAYICYDRGGLRLVAISDPLHAKQIGQYCYEPLIDKATAYNSICIYNNYAFLSLDYYGMEILDISDPSHLKQVSWWHPPTWADTTNNFQIWANSRGHANELIYDSSCHKIYMACGRTDIAVLDVEDPSHPITCLEFGSDSDDYGTWGIDFYKQKAYASYIWSPFFPPYSNYTGFRIVDVKGCQATDTKYFNKEKLIQDFQIHTEDDYIQINFKEEIQKVLVSLYNVDGKKLQIQTFQNKQQVKIPFQFNQGIYWLVLQAGSQQEVIKFFHR